MGRDENTPKWVQHLALRVKDEATLLEAKAHLENNGVDVLGVTNHGIFHSIYFSIRMDTVSNSLMMIRARLKRLQKLPIRSNKRC